MRCPICTIGEMEEINYGQLVCFECDHLIEEEQDGDKEESLGDM